MSAFDSFQNVGGDIPYLFKRRDAGLLEDIGGELVCEDKQIAGLRPVVSRRVGDFVESVGNFRREANCAVPRQGPRCCRPDDDRSICETAEFRRHWKFHPHRVARVILVLDLSFGERGLFHHAPHHRLRAAIERAVGGEFHELARDLRFGRETHRSVGMIPVTDDAEAFEFFALDIDPFLRERTALLAEFDDRHRVLVLALGAILFLDLPFDRQAVTVPTRNVVGVVAKHLLAARHHVFENFIERVADMNVAVGVGRPVMQHEFCAALRALAQLSVEIDLAPALQYLRLLLRQARTHRKVRLRQIKRFGIVGCVRLLTV